MDIKLITAILSTLVALGSIVGQAPFVSALNIVTAGNGAFCVAAITVLSTISAVVLANLTEAVPVTLAKIQQQKETQ